MTNASLSFGSLPLRLGRSHVLGAGEPCIAAIPDGADFGNPEAVVASVASLLMDGDKSEVTRYGNQLVRIPLEISGDDLNVVAAGEALVMAEVNRGRNIITWTPPGPIGPAEPNVHDVVYSRLEFHFDDLSENRAIRKFTLILECAPFARPPEPTVVVAVPVPDVPAVWTTINDCTSTAGWSRIAPYSVSLAPGGTAIRTSNNPFPTPTPLILTGLSTVFAAGEYLVVDNQYSTGELPPAFMVRMAGGALVSVSVVAHETVAVDRFRSYLRMPAGTLAELRIMLGYAQWAATPWHDVHDVSKVSRLPHLGTPYQRAFTAELGGTARTQADIQLETKPGTTLGRELMVYTAGSTRAMQPPLRKWKTGGGVDEPDASTVSGYRSSLSLTVGTGFSFPIPRPGMHLLLGRLKGFGSGTMTVQYSASNAVRTYGGNLDTGTADVPITSAWRLYLLGMLMLPTTAVPEPSSTRQEITIFGDCAWDDFYLCNLDEGALSIFTGLDAGSALPTRAVIRSASLESPRPAWLVGTRGTTVDDVDVSDRMLSPGVHEIEPGLLDIFVMSPSGEITATVQAYERFMHHVTRKSA